MRLALLIGLGLLVLFFGGIAWAMVWFAQSDADHHRAAWDDYPGDRPWGER